MTGTVSPKNIGKGIIWNEATHQYEVNLGEGLYIDSAGKIQLTQKDVQIRTTDNGTGRIVHQQAIIDFGAFIEVSGTVTLPLLDPKRFADITYGDSTHLAELARLSNLYGFKVWTATCQKCNAKELGLTKHEADNIYYTESAIEIPLESLGMSKVISASATAGDIDGYFKETAWIVNNITGSSTHIPVGIHVYYPDNILECPVSYSIRGLKR